MTLTPDQLRKRERDIEVLKKDWEVHVLTKELRRKRKTGIAMLIDLFWKRKHTVKTLYLWTTEQFYSFQLMTEKVPLKHDNIPKPKEIPYIFALKNGWTIPNDDLKTLTKGPLVSETGEMLVSSDGGLLYIWNKLWPFVVVAAVLLGLVRSIAWVLGE